MRLWNNEPMSRHTTFKIGGPAEALASPENEGELMELISRHPTAVIGAGSNVLVRDAGIRGLTVLVGAEYANIEVEGEYIISEAGARLSAVANAAMRAGLAGLEFASGIPGSVGGGAAMNAGAYGHEISEVFHSARAIMNGAIRELNPADMEFGYRRTMPLFSGAVITRAKFKLTPDAPEAIKARMDDYNARRREKQPLDMPSAGSVFKRPEGHFAGALIEQAGLKGRRVGGAMVSEKHAGFIVNAGDATASDVLELIALIQRSVFDMSGITLETEIRVI